MHRVLPPTSTVRLFCTRDPFATPSVDAAVEKGFSTERVQAVAKKAQERNQNEQRGPLSNLSNIFKSVHIQYMMERNRIVEVAPGPNWKEARREGHSGVGKTKDSRQWE